MYHLVKFQLKGKKAITLATLKPSVAIGNDPVVIDLIVLFLRLMSALAKALDKKVQAYVEDSGNDTGSDTDNASVVSLSACKEDTEEEDKIQKRSRNTGHSCEFHVIDVGYLLRRVIWDMFSRYNEIIQKYINNVQSRSRKCAVVFDGYRDGPSTKDHEHRRRLIKVVISPDLCANLESEFS